MVREVPFYENTPDNTHCYQACLRMVLKYFLPKQDFTFAELDALTDKVEGMWTWPQAGILNLRKMGFEVVMLDPFDYNRFIVEGKDYIVDEYGAAVAEEQETHSDIPQAIEYCQQLVEEEIEFNLDPKLSDIEDLLSAGYLVIASVNARTLNHKEGYEGHFVVVYAMDEESIQFHDPGLAPHQSREESLTFFEHAWSVERAAYAFRLSD